MKSLPVFKNFQPFKVSAEGKNFGVVYLSPAQNFKRSDATNKVYQFPRGGVFEFGDVAS